MPNLEIARARLVSQRIAGSGPATVADVVRHMGALQAQDYNASLWAIGVRAKGATVRDVEEAVERREIARTWPMRGTLHWVPAEDLRWMVELLAPRAIAKAAARTRQLEIDSAVLSRARALLETALRDGGGISRPGAYALFEANGLRPDGQRGIHILQQLAQRGVLCFGPRAGKQPTFALTERWLPEGAQPGGDEALARLVRRYFVSHGPATPHDFAWWTGLTVSDARRGLAMVAGELEQLEVDGAHYWFEPAAAAPEPGGLFLIPGFDEFILGYTDRTAVLSPEHAKRLVPGNNGMFLSAIVAGSGEVLGTWSRRSAGGRVTIVPEWFDERVTRAGAFEAAAARVAHFMSPAV